MSLVIIVISLTNIAFIDVLRILVKSSLGLGRRDFVVLLAVLTVSWGIAFWLSGLLYSMPLNSYRSNYKERCSDI